MIAPLAIGVAWDALCINHILCVYDDFRVFSGRLCFVPVLDFPRGEIAVLAASSRLSAN